METIEGILRRATEENQHETDWTAAWSGKYPVLKRYPSEVEVPKYEAALRELLRRLRQEQGYSRQDAMLVLKDMLYRVYRCDGAESGEVKSK